LPRTRAWINGTGLGIWASGAGWLWFHYFLRRSGPFGPESHWLEPWWLKVHGAFAFLALWTGGTLFGALCALSVTGHLLYYVADDRARAIIS